MNYQELKSLVTSISKLRSQVDGLKYYLHTLKSNDKNVKNIKLIVADMQNLIIADFNKIERLSQDEIRDEDNKARMEKLISKYPKDADKAEQVAKFLGIQKAVVDNAIKIHRANLAKEVIKHGREQVSKSAPKPRFGQKESIR